MTPNGRVEIHEEPAPKLKRFRYESEGRSAPLEGVRTTPRKKSFPSIRVVNYTGKARVVVSCVTADHPYRQHPHKLVGRNCVNGICHIPEFYTDSSDPTVLSFPELRIQSCLISEIPARLQERASFNINPFDLSAYGVDDLKRDIHKVRLCFQVIYNPDPNNRAIRGQFEPIVSQIITNNKAAAEVKIHDISDLSSPASGGKKIMIFCNKITKEDIEVRFYEEDATKRQTLIGLGSFQPHNVHRDVAIAITTPKYNFRSVDKQPNIFIQMVRPSDDTKSNRIPFRYIPDVNEIDLMTLRKKPKVDQSKNLFEYLGSGGYGNFASNVQQQHNLPQQQPNSPQQLHGLPDQQHGLPDQQNGLPQQQYELPQQQHGLPQQHPNSPHQQHGLPQHQPYSPQQQHGLPQQQPNSNLPDQQHGLPQQHPNLSQQQHGLPQQQPNSPQQLHGLPDQQHGLPDQQHGLPQQQYGLSQQHPNLPQQQPNSPQQLHGLPDQQHDWRKTPMICGGFTRGTVKQLLNITQQQNLPQQSSHHYIPQQQDRNLPQQLITQEHRNEQPQHDPHYIVQDQYTPLESVNNFLQQQNDLQLIDGLNIEDELSYIPLTEICLSYPLDGHIMLSESDIWNNEHNVAGPSPNNRFARLKQ